MPEQGRAGQRELSGATFSPKHTNQCCSLSVALEVSPAGAFWEAEPEHQDYLKRIPDGYTCYRRGERTLRQRVCCVLTPSMLNSAEELNA